ncbi:MAG TPA: hypothetical protein P5137_03060 [Candidatus Brocadiia bacterium]|nr:hypothetical protein [Candidatus Brocadiia bacterium]
MKKLACRALALACVAPLAALLAACSSEGVRYDPSQEVVLTQDFNTTDFQVIVKQGIEKLMAKTQKDLGQSALSGRPRVFVAPVANNTDQHIELSIVRQYLESELTDRANVELVDRAKAQSLALNEIRFQQGDLVDPASAQKAGKFLGAAFFLYAELSSQKAVTRSGSEETQLYAFSLSLIKVDTLQKIPVFVQIQKVAKKGLFGW